MMPNITDSYDNCSTILVGRNASATGYVLMAHGEDDSGCVSQVHRVPRMQHGEGEVLTFADGAAVIPQVSETWAYLWTEHRGPGGIPFADGFLNEWGVAISSDSCVSTRSASEEPPRGLGYGMRRLLAERSRTAREGVELAAELMQKYGYRSTRAYHIADKNEAWSVQLTVGSQFAARRVGDDEIYYIPNWLTIHGIDFTDTEHRNFYWSEDLVGYAIRNGWYQPKVPGDYRDFDFAAVYQGPDSEGKSNFDRTKLAWQQITGAGPMPDRTFSIPAPRKFSVADLKSILRSHYLEYDEDRKADPAMSPHRFGICRDTTVESFVVEFAEKAALTVLWRAAPRPCVSPYIPWFCGITRPAKGYTWMGVKASQASHLDPDETEFRYRPDLAYWAFHTLMNTMEFDYPAGAPLVHGEIAQLEALWTATVPEIRAAYLRLLETNEAAAAELLTDWTHAQAQKAWDWAGQMNQMLIDRKNAENIAAWRRLL